MSPDEEGAKNFAKVVAKQSINVAEMDGMDEYNLILRAWTCVERFNNKEFCGYLNQALREDKEPAINHAVVISRGMNQYLSAARKGASITWPDGVNSDAANA